jgi:hypothetical protein
MNQIELSLKSMLVHDENSAESHNIPKASKRKAVLIYT